MNRTSLYAARLEIAVISQDEVVAAVAPKAHVEVYR